MIGNTTEDAAFQALAVVESGVGNTNGTLFIPLEAALEQLAAVTS